MTSQIPTSLVIPVYVPKPGTYWRTQIEPGSGVAGEPEGLGIENTGGPVRIWYQGTVGASERPDQREAFADRVHLAADRMVTRYPTAAFGAAGPDDLILVGMFDYRQGTIELISDEGTQALADWLGVDAVRPEELTATAGSYEQRRMWERVLKEPGHAPMHHQARRALERINEVQEELLGRYAGGGEALPAARNSRGRHGRR